ncbi:MULTISPECIES: hypothetical protein [unclassified Streptomyces]|uniref:hypothetical protein n=1 Tax=unclassified Streptomyces TaxID=2593676 RepID=UPI002DDAA6FB|nr:MULTISPECIES: hypothetical protein [unclassified Streptomyces]WSA95554.1 hypothetical protein OIE63_31275 [Streptomyces sp. NBC_01795]WSB79968.1 hypothetical protein OHB04_32385 [Streptomyces sp. NBC_01775]WSS11824.1 hypothetical protein OG533_07825 [Streptomyces sp. NBC_01186]WSS40537.1 hypothetical protein OG220_07975 [Streptomyces sp. NBC_01187]
MVTPDTTHEAAVQRANAALETYAFSPDGWRRPPGETLRQLLGDLMHWCEDTQRDFDAALEAARGGPRRCGASAPR